MNKNEMQDSLNHHKSLLVVINETLKDNLSRYRRASELAEQMLKLCCENPEDSSVNGFLVLLREIVPRESVITLELIKGALLQSEILKTITAPQAFRRNTFEEKRENDIIQKFQLLKQPKQNHSNANNGVLRHNQASKNFKDALVSINQSRQVRQIEDSKESEEKSLKGERKWTRKRNPIIDKIAVKDNEENDIKFRRYMKRINQFEEDHNLKITEIFKDKELFLKRTQNKSLPICSVLDKRDKLLVVKLETILDNQDDVADLLKLNKALVQKLVRLFDIINFE